MNSKRGLYALVFFSLVAEGPGAYGGGYWHLPFASVYELLFDWKPLVAPFFDVFTLALIWLAPPRAVYGEQTSGANPITRAVLVGAATIALSAMWGFLRGCNSYQIQFQVHALLAGYLLTFAIRRQLRSREDYLTLGRVVVVAALYRALMCLMFYLLVLRENVLNPPPEYITSHDDTVLFVVALVTVLVYGGTYALGPSSARRIIAVCVIVLIGIQLNNRRLAWVSLIGALVAVYSALPADQLRAKFKRYALLLAPLLALYVVVGWGRPESIFKPLRSLSTVTPGKEDASTRSRDAENAGLIVTTMSSPWLGTGWGHQYIEIDSSLAATGFLQYRYLPHNSVLGVLAFTGLLGFAGIWMVFPVATFVAVRATYHGRDPTVRLFGLSILVCIVVSINQMWGDLGLVSYTVMVVMASALACASHLPSFDPAVGAEADFADDAAELAEDRASTP